MDARRSLTTTSLRCCFCFRCSSMSSSINDSLGDDDSPKPEASGCKMRESCSSHSDSNSGVEGQLKAWIEDDDAKRSLCECALLLNLTMQFTNNISSCARNDHLNHMQQQSPTLQDNLQELFSMFTCFYALVLVIIGLIFELSHVLSEKAMESNMDQAKDMLFSVYMYGGSLAFFIYCYAVLLNTRMSRHIVNGMRRATERTLKLDSPIRESIPFMRKKDGSEAQKKEPKASHSKAKSSTGSLYLRLGCVVFGIFGIVYYGLIIVVCVLGWGTDKADCNAYTLVISTLATLFIFVQMHFIFCNSKITVHGSLKIARLGMMHLTATNLWTWMRYILLEEEATTEELAHANFATRIPVHHFFNKTSAELVHPQLREHVEYELCRGAGCVLGSFKEFMYTCVVEYALICAGVSFVFWTNVGKEPSKYQMLKRQRSNLISVDCSRTTTGLFLGFIIIAFTFVCIAIFNAYIHEENSRLLANTIFFSTDGILLLVSLAAIVFAFCRMRNLNFKKREDGDVDESAELLDHILLVVGLVGELIFSIGGIMSLSNATEFNYMIVILLIVQNLRLFQVILQSALLLIGAKLKAASPELKVLKPGKQVVTFLLVVNIALFIMNTFEAQKAGVTEDIVRYYGSKAWALLVRGCSPLTIFYRFHSSVCFAEIWKHTFKGTRGELEMGY
ncbi:Otopetrin-1 [Toxocara canis]|uniref:Otopetrin-1 n=1 Tax=Toxocara canis TaxID=6265 RepID=A0A0B2VUM5_TOXCA|nr:Otopetrin-1 [Toxocara canis]